MFTRHAVGAVYVGIDPTGKRGFGRWLVTEMTREQLAAWCAIDSATASRYVIAAALVDAMIEAPIIDNEPEAELPKLPEHATKPRQRR